MHLATNKIPLKTNNKSEIKFKLKKSTLMGGKGDFYKIIDCETNEDLCHVDFAEKEVKILYSFSGCEINKLQNIINFIRQIDFFGE